MNNLTNELEQSENSFFLIDGEHLSQLKDKTKNSKGARLSKEGRKAVKIFRSNRSNKRAQV
jgi:hypothetical protein